MTEPETAALIIRLGVGIVMLSFGLYQFLKPHAWLQYIPRPVSFIMPLDKTTIMRVHSLGNVTLGALFVLGLWVPVVMWLVLAWWLWILPIAAMRDVAVGLRDFGIIAAIAAFIVLQ